MTRTLGVLGGGQLGMYFVQAARRLGFRTVVLDPDPHCPAAAHADEHIIAPYTDMSALDRLATTCEAVTVEFENVPAGALASLQPRVCLRPSASAVATAQDRRLEKGFLRSAGIPVAPFEVVGTEDDAERVARAATIDGVPFLRAVLKTATLGYDGKGQVRLDGPGDLVAAHRELGAVPCVLESLVPLDCEISVVLARTADGDIALFEPTVNEHRRGILYSSTAPLVAPGMSRVVEEARTTAARLAEQLQYVGVLGVEFFVSEGHLLVNEIAPRPHNSGHWTLDAAATSQFEQQVRVLAGMPLGDPSMSSAGVAMVNILGDMWNGGEPRWSVLAREQGAQLHLYGKSSPRPGRKMGHLTVLSGDPEGALSRAEQLLLGTTEHTGG